MTVAARSWLALSLIELVGAATLSLLSSDLSRWGMAARLGLSFGLGQIVLSLWLFIASCFGLVPTWWLGVGELFVLCVAIGVLRPRAAHAWWARRRKNPTDTPAPIRWLEVALVALLASVWLTVSAASVMEPLAEWDDISFWALKAKVLLHQPISSATYFTDSRYAYSQLDYPLLWPFTMAWIWSLVGDTDLESLKWLTPAMFAAIAASIYGLVRRRAKRQHALLFTTILFALPMELSQTSRLSADVQLGFLVLGSFACCYLWLESGDEDDLRVAAVFAAGMLLTKNEGIAFLIILIASSAITMASRGIRGRWLSASKGLLAVPLSLAAPWLLFRATIPKVNIDYGARLNPEVLWANHGRVAEVLIRSVAYFGDLSDWLVFWPTVALVIVLTAERWLRSESSFLVLALTFSLFGYGLAYVVSPWELDEIMSSTANRLLLHVTPLSAFLLAELTAAGALVPWQAFREPSRAGGS